MFLNVDFPIQVSGGVSGGAERRVDIVSLSSGAEERNARWKHSRRSFDASSGVRDADDLSQVVAFFEQVGGALHSFRFRDWSDFKSCLPQSVPDARDQIIGVGDGSATRFQLVKRYGAGALVYVRDITKPRAGSVSVSVSGADQSSDWSVDPVSGRIDFVTPPAAGAEIRAGFLFDVPCRFDLQKIEVDMKYFSEIEGRGMGAIGQIPIIEVRE